MYGVLLIAVVLSQVCSMGVDDLSAILKNQEAIETRMQDYIISSIGEMLEQRIALLEAGIKESLNEQFRSIKSKCEQLMVVSEKKGIERNSSLQSIASMISDNELVEKEQTTEEEITVPEQLHDSILMTPKESNITCHIVEGDFYPPAKSDQSQSLLDQRSSLLRAHRRSNIFEQDVMAAGDEDDGFGGRRRRRVKNLCDVRRAVYFFFGFTAANPARNERGFFAIHPTSPFFACASPCRAPTRPRPMLAALGRRSLASPPRPLKHESSQAHPTVPRARNQPFASASTDRVLAGPSPSAPTAADFVPAERQRDASSHGEAQPARRWAARGRPRSVRGEQRGARAAREADAHGEKAGMKGKKLAQ